MNNAAMPSVLVTGASGFVGQRLTHLLGESGRPVRAAFRRVGLTSESVKVESIFTGDLSPEICWRAALLRVDTIVHLAARVYVMHETATDALAEFRRVNVLGTLQLARQAADSGVRRFVFVSSVKVNGELTQLGRPFSADDRPAPVDAYGVSKLEAEQALLDLAKTTGLEVVIIRPVLIYGPGVKANFLKMMQWLYRGMPLPFGLVNNQRSLVGLDNMLSLIMTCLDHPAAKNQIFLVSDGEDLSTPELLRRTAKALGKNARLLPLPTSVLAAAAGVFGKRDLAQRLCGSLQVDIDKTRELLGWAPFLSVDEALDVTARDFLRNL